MWFEIPGRPCSGGSSLAFRVCMAGFLLSTTIVSAWQIPLPGGGKVALEDGGILRIQLKSDPSIQSLSLPDDPTIIDEGILKSLEVRDTGTRKGFGVFAVQDIQQHAFLGLYPQDNTIVGRSTLDSLVTSGSTNMDYILAVDGGAIFLDGFHVAQSCRSTGKYSPVMLNHADKGSMECNCVRILENASVGFFTSRLIRSGEELCFDYGPSYWEGNENNKI